MFRENGVDADALNRALGAYAMKRALKNAGWTNEQIKEQHMAIMEAPDFVIQFMGGKQVYEEIPGAWREPMFTVSALRMLVERAGIDMSKIAAEMTQEDRQDVHITT